MNYGRYQIVREVGRGSMGVVYEAYDPHIDRSVALKVLREDRVTSEAFVDRFLKEARAIGRLSHQNIVTVYDADKDHGTIYIAMEFIKGMSLDKIVQERKMTSDEIVAIGIQVAETLDYAHRKGIVHRDIKPSNILVMPDNQIKITDFGIAHIEDPSAPQLTQAGEILGTPAYMSPEQVMGKSVDGRSDLYSLGVILYELCTGSRPFHAENLAALFRAITQDSPPEPLKINANMPEGLSQVITKCLKKEPIERFQSGAVLTEALKNLHRIKEPTIQKVSVPEKRSKKLVFTMGVLLLCICLFGGLAYYFFKPSKPVPLPIPQVMLNIKSTPNEAQVFIDGKFTGKTPLGLKLSSGKHEVRLTHTDFYDWEGQVKLEENGEVPLSIRLVPIEENNP